MRLNKKYFPLLLLLGAVLFFAWVKKNQRGLPGKTHSSVSVPATQPEDFDRDPRVIEYSRHARCRMACRHIDESEVKEILAEGILNNDRIERNDKGISYPLEGRTHDGQHVRIVYAPKKDKMVIVTVIDLDTDYVCDCP